MAPKTIRALQVEGADKGQVHRVQADARIYRQESADYSHPFSDSHRTGKTGRTKQVGFSESVMVAAGADEQYEGTEGKFVDMFAVRILCLLICLDTA